MAVASTSSSLRLLPLLLLLLLAATSEATTFKIINQCSYTVWPATLPGGGMKLDPGETWVLDVPAGTMGGRIWARTDCSFHGEGNGSCQTGGCGGLLACKGYGQPPNTMGEFTLGQGQTSDFFDISLLDGFNVPMDFLPVLVQGMSECAKGPRWIFSSRMVDITDHGKGGYLQLWHRGDGNHQWKKEPRHFPVRRERPSHHP